jgi:hypothetical protein
MKKIIFLISAFWLFNLCVAAQNKPVESNPDLSGTWIFDAKSSWVDNDFKRDFKNYTLVIVHAEPEIKITRSAVLKNENISADLILYSDKRGEKNQPYFRVRTQEVKSKTFWKKGVLVRESTESFSPNANWHINTTEKYILSGDKKTLTISGTMSSNAPGEFMSSSGNGSYKWIFRKKE